MEGENLKKGTLAHVVIFYNIREKCRNFEGKRSEAAYQLGSWEWCWWPGEGEGWCCLSSRKIETLDVKFYTKCKQIQEEM